jgi:hypothetical protein
MSTRVGTSALVRQRRLAHLREARRHQQCYEFHRGVEQFFASLGDEAGVTDARRASERAWQHIERERQYLQSLDVGQPSSVPARESWSR